MNGFEPATIKLSKNVDVQGKGPIKCTPMKKQGRDENIGRSFRVVLQDLSHFYCVYGVNVE